MVISRVPPRWGTVSFLSTTMSIADAGEAREPFGRPPKFPLRPLLNQPGFRFLPERDFLFTVFLLTMSSVQDAARGPSVPTSVQRPHRRRPDRCRARGSAARSARLPEASFQSPEKDQARDRP